MIKNVGKGVLILLFIVVTVYGYVEFRKVDVKKNVNHYLLAEKKVPEKDIISMEPFMANLSGSRKWMVAVKLKNDTATYYYCKYKGKIVLESFIKDGYEEVVTPTAK